MSEVPQGAPAPVAIPAPAVPTVTPAAPAPTPVMVSDLPEQALKARLDQAKSAAQKELLDSLGITDPAQAKAAIEAAKAAEEAKKTHEQRLAEQSLKLTSQEEGLAAAVDTFAALITPEQKAAIDGIAGNDKATWLKTYRAMAPTWNKATAPAAPAPVPGTVTPAAPAAPTSTAPAAPAPSPTNPITSPTDHVAVYANLKQTNPFAASAYLNKHGDACYPKT